MLKLLEVIVTSAEEAVEAERGGADRLELVRDLSDGGLTPSFATVEDVLRAVSIPVRVMVRENSSMSLGGPAELLVLKSRAAEFAQLAIDGMVLGFLHDGVVDVEATREVLEAARGCRVTFHRAFDELADPASAISELKGLRQIDRILTNGGTGTSEQRIVRLLECQKAASPEIHILTAAGLCAEFWNLLSAQPELTEIHIGRAARLPHTTSGRVDRDQIASMKSR